jgi:hypothetical protein
MKIWNFQCYQLRASQIIEPTSIMALPWHSHTSLKHFAICLLCGPPIVYNPGAAYILSYCVRKLRIIKCDSNNYIMCVCILVEEIQADFNCFKIK